MNVKSVIYLVLAQLAFGFGCADSHFMDKTKLDGSILMGDTVEINDPVSKRVVVIAQNFDLKEQKIQYFGLCTGIIITPNTILTAAHCAKNFKTSAVLFTNDIHSTHINADQIFQIQDAILFTDEIKTSNTSLKISYTDIALLKLSQPIRKADIDLNYLMSVSTRQYIKNTLDTHDSELLLPLIAGYGKTDLTALNSVTKPINGVLEKANVKISKWQYLNRSILINQDQSAGVCSGDSGGPLFIKRSGQLYLQGLAVAVISNTQDSISDAKKCQGVGIFLNLDFYKDWILKNIPAETN